MPSRFPSKLKSVIIEGRLSVFSNTIFWVNITHFSSLKPSGPKELLPESLTATFGSPFFENASTGVFSGFLTL
ncbi:hypothetical protein DYBT9275_00243 [Dyadobacter sp. CECT 9275]|uniref:Uncharacterized protein n=1 Tax=Dyadobacter helix TaxID=2822344 RepID=A0A916NAP4_9BACT|nr:hypothetical protein DYBT9275_00243 [Dyadobacter sp. CECT 9275]